MNYEVMVGIVVVGALGWKLLDKLPPNFMKSIDTGANVGGMLSCWFKGKGGGDS